MALWTPLCWWFSIQNFPSFNSYPLTPVLLLCTSKRSLTWHKSSFFQFSKICFILCKRVTWSIVPLLSQIIDHRALQPVTCLPHHIHADAGTKAFWQKCRKYALPSPQQPSPFYTPNYRLFSNTVIFQQILNLFSQLARYHIMHRPAVFYVKVFNFQTGINFFFIILSYFSETCSWQFEKTSSIPGTGLCLFFGQLFFYAFRMSLWRKWNERRWKRK